MEIHQGRHIMLKRVAGLSIALILFVSLLNTATASTYTIQYGDTLWKIATKHGTTIDKLVNFNKMKHTYLMPGDQIEIPKPTKYSVISGDTFYKIAIKFDVSLSELIKANPQIVNPSQIFIGQVINLPAQEETGMIYMGSTGKKRVALTFDDGPDKIYTMKILEILKEKNVKATFFVVGQQVQRYPELTKQIHDEGHTLANHTWDHAKLPYLTDEQFINNIESTSLEIEKVIGIKPDLFRPPYGYIKDEQVQKLNDLGYRSVMWSIDTNDWSGNTSDDILRRVHRNVSPGGIMLLHNFEVPGHLDGMIEALPQIINQLRAQGYEFVTVDLLLAK